ncbi:hypothetical protein HK098_005243 [Nowakowskiella sp. JEL0407]|nr:hypothetical protein HK098_005243 [Nowakowskiella sp. JEL0407]
MNTRKTSPVKSAIREFQIENPQATWSDFKKAIADKRKNLQPSQKSSDARLDDFLYRLSSARVTWGLVHEDLKRSKNAEKALNFQTDIGEAHKTVVNQLLPLKHIAGMEGRVAGRGMTEFLFESWEDIEDEMDFSLPSSPLQGLGTSVKDANNTIPVTRRLAKRKGTPDNESASNSDPVENQDADYNSLHDEAAQTPKRNRGSSRAGVVELDISLASDEYVHTSTIWGFLTIVSNSNGTTVPDRNAITEGKVAANQNAGESDNEQEDEGQDDEIDIDSAERDALEDQFLEYPEDKIEYDGINVTDRFHEFVLKLIKERENISLNSPAKVCALSHMIVLTKKRPDEYKELFRDAEWMRIWKEFEHEEFKFSEELSDRVDDILKLAKKKNLGKLFGSFGKSSDTLDEKVDDQILTTVNTLRANSDGSAVTDTTEPTYVNKFVSPVHLPVQLQSNAGVFSVNWDTTATSSKLRKTLLFPNKGMKRPDCSYTSRYGLGIGNGEVKINESVLEERKDFIKLAHELKHDIDEIVERCEVTEDDDVYTLGWQISQSKITFYKLKLMKGGIYVLIEIGSANLPTHLSLTGCEDAICGMIKLADELKILADFVNNLPPKSGKKGSPITFPTWDSPSLKNLKNKIEEKEAYTTPERS